MSKTVNAADLVVGDIFEEKIGTVTMRKIVVKQTAKSAVTKSENGQDGRVSHTRKVKGQPTPQRVEVVAHRDLTDLELKTLTSYYRLTERQQAMLHHGFAPGVPAMHELFGLTEPGYGYLVNDVTVVRTITSSEFPDGDRVEIVRKDDFTHYTTAGKETITVWGARVIDGEYGIPVGYVKWTLASEEDAETAADLYLGKRYFDDWEPDEALRQARFLADGLCKRVV